MKKCPYCAEDIQDAAVFCRFCRQPITRSTAPPIAPSAATPKEVSAWDIWIVRAGVKGFLVLFAGMIAAGALLMWVAPAPKKPYVSPLEAKFPASNLPETPAVALTFSASDVIEQYDANEIAADQRLKGLLIELSDPVTDIGTDLLGSPYLKFGRPLHGLQAMFDRDEASELAAISKGRTVRVRCRIAGKAIGNIVAKDCELLH